MTVSRRSFVTALKSPTSGSAVGYLGLIDGCVLITGNRVDGKKFAAGCINTVLNGTDL